jgi:hypothetical protein
VSLVGRAPHAITQCHGCRVGLSGTRQPPAHAISGSNNACDPLTRATHSLPFVSRHLEPAVSLRKLLIRERPVTRRSIKKHCHAFKNLLRRGNAKPNHNPSVDNIPGQEWIYGISSLPASTQYEILIPKKPPDLQDQVSIINDTGSHCSGVSTTGYPGGLSIHVIRQTSDNFMVLAQGQCKTCDIANNDFLQRSQNGGG